MSLDVSRKRPLQSTSAWVWICASLVAVWAGCIVNVPEIDCANTDDCPNGMRCSRGVCVEDGDSSDVATDPRRDPDGQDAAADRPADPPEDSTDGEGDDVDVTPTDAADSREDAEDAVVDAVVDAVTDPDLADAASDPELADAATDPEVDVNPNPLDPAPDFSEPGDYSCTVGPDSTLAEFTRERTAEALDSIVLAGTVTGVTGDGVWYVRDHDGAEQLGDVVTSETGVFQAVVPTWCGASVVKLVWPGTPCQYVAVFAVNTSTCRTDDLHLALFWNPEGDNLDLHLVQPGGHLNDGSNDCSSLTCIDGTLDWGTAGAEGDPAKDVDGTDGGGPENIELSGAVSGTYGVYVERWTQETSAPSDATVILSLLGRPTAVQIGEIPSRRVWHAADIQWPAGTSTPYTTVIDCSGEDWGTTGCPLSIPDP